MEAFEQAKKEFSGLGGAVYGSANLWRHSPGQSKLEGLLNSLIADIDGSVSEGARQTNQNFIPSASDLGSEERLNSKKEALDNWLKSKLASPTATSAGIFLDKYSKTALPKDYVAPPKMILMKDKSGAQHMVPENNVEKAIKQFKWKKM
mgnify:CR=1 FL=1